MRSSSRRFRSWICILLVCVCGLAFASMPAMAGKKKKKNGGGKSDSSRQAERERKRQRQADEERRKAERQARQAEERQARRQQQAREEAERHERKQRKEAAERQARQARKAREEAEKQARKARKAREEAELRAKKQRKEAAEQQARVARKARKAREEAELRARKQRKEEAEQQARQARKAREEAGKQARRTHQGGGNRKTASRRGNERRRKSAGEVAAVKPDSRETDATGPAARAVDGKSAGGAVKPSAAQLVLSRMKGWMTKYGTPAANKLKDLHRSNKAKVARRLETFLAHSGEMLNRTLSDPEQRRRAIDSVVKTLEVVDTIHEAKDRAVDESLDAIGNRVKVCYRGRWMSLNQFAGRLIAERCPHLAGSTITDEPLHALVYVLQGNLNYALVDLKIFKVGDDRFVSLSEAMQEKAGLKLTPELRALIALQKTLSSGKGSADCLTSLRKLAA